MAINKVVYNNETLIDISSDTVTADKLGYGITAHDSSGQRITGTVNMSGATNIPTKVSDLDNDAGFIQNGTVDDVTFGGNVAVNNGGLLRIFSFVILNNVSISANNINAGTYTITTSVIPSDWTPIAISGFYANSRYINVFEIRLSDDDSRTIRYGVYNDRSSATTMSMRVHVLCVRTSFT